MILFNRYLLVKFDGAGITVGGRQKLVGARIAHPPKIEFDFRHTRERGANEGSVSIYNLSAATLRKVAVENAHVVVEAGYWPHEGTKYTGVIFSGIITKVETTKVDEVTKVSTFTLKHGWKGFRNSKTKRKFASGTKHAVIVKALVADIVAADDKLSPGVIEVPDASEVRPRTIEAGTIRTLDDYCTQHDLEWLIQDGKVHVLSLDDELSDGKVVLTPDSGMIGEPKTADHGIEIQTLMIPTIRPGQLIRHANKYVKRAEASFVVDEVHFAGSNTDGPFGATINSRKTKDKPAKPTKKGRKRSAATPTRRRRQA